MKKLFLLTMAAARAAENHGDEMKYKDLSIFLYLNPNYPEPLSSGLPELYYYSLDCNFKKKPLESL